MRIGIAGLGTVGAGLIELIQKHGDLLARRGGKSLEITAVSARDKSRDRGVDCSGYEWFDNAVDLAASDKVDVVVELIGGSDGIAREVVGESPTYVSFDVDCLDPVFAPGTGTPEIGGLTTFEAQQVIRGLRGLNLIGADLVEVSPPFDPSGATALVGATLMWEMLCLMSENINREKN